MTENKEKIKKPPWPLLINTSLFLITCLIMFGLAEIACRLFYDESVNYDEQVRKELQGHNALELANIAGKTYADRKTGLRYSLENNALEESEYLQFGCGSVDKAKKINKYRILISGDSFTRGGGVKQESERYTVQLCQMLNDKKEVNIEGVDGFELVVVSDGGLNTYQESILIKESGLAYNPDLVILQYTSNDFGPIRTELGWTGSGIYIYSRASVLLLGNRVVPALPYLSKEISWFLLKNSAFLRFLSYRLNVVVTNTIDPLLYAGWPTYLDAVREIYKMTKEKNIPFIIIDMPPPSIKMNACRDGGQISLRSDLRRTAADLSIPFFSMCDYVQDIYSIKSELEPEDGYHYGTEGYRLAATILKDAILDIIKKANYK